MDFTIQIFRPVFVWLQKGKTRPVHIVDVPGHSRLRLKLDEFLPQAAGIVFVVDSVEFLPNSRTAAEYLLLTINLHMDYLLDN